MKIIDKTILLFVHIDFPIVCCLCLIILIATFWVTQLENYDIVSQILTTGRVSGINNQSPFMFFKYPLRLNKQQASAESGLRLKRTPMVRKPMFEWIMRQSVYRNFRPQKWKIPTSPWRSRLWMIGNSLFRLVVVLPFLHNICCVKG